MDAAARSSGTLLLFCTVVLTGAFLLFEIQPIIGKIVTPLYGGVAAVWTICMLFFQSTLLAGYILTLALSAAPVPLQLIVYPLLFLASLLWAGIPPASAWTVSPGGSPVLELLASLSTHVAVPCLLLSTVSGMMQVWFNHAGLGDPYRLYGVSNAGSIGALLAYPFVIEPSFALGQALSWWSCTYLTLVLLVVTASALVRAQLKGGKQEASAQAKPTGLPAVSPGQFFWWILTTTLGSATLLSFTSYLTTDVSPMPLLWVVPLAIYLLTFVLAFGDIRSYRRGLLLGTWMPIAALEPLCSQTSLLLGLPVNLLLMFQLCMICHGELASSKPAPAKLPVFYLAVAVGGACGGVLVGIVAPSVLPFEIERLLVVGLIGLFTIYHLAWKKFLAAGRRAPVVVSVLLLAALPFVCWHYLAPKKVLHFERNFYGSARVVQEDDYRFLQNGSTIQGFESSKAAGPLKGGPYFPPMKLAIDCLHRLHRDRPLAIGCIGLGVGAVAQFARPGDSLTFYEIDPKIEPIARRYFTFLNNTGARTQVLTGDGRTLLTRLPEQSFDLLIVDAFNGDAVPTHLLTREAFGVYLRHLRPDGCLWFQISNRNVDLEPVLANISKALGLKCVMITYLDAVKHVLVTRDQHTVDAIAAMGTREFLHMSVNKARERANVGIWTDDFSSLLPVLKLNLVRHGL
ncbi:MAG TPA: fused MFS/spermidine synthase [Candidatus Obscuribacterales bacterium]